MNKIKLVLDSGAFSAWRQNDPLKAKRYGKFVLDHPDCFSAVVNLDVIPGRPGQVRTQEMVEQAAEQGWKNWLTLRGMGIDAMPVYHLGERRYWLEKMVGDGAKYIGLGGFARTREDVRMEFLDRTFAWLCGSKGFPPVKLHGFGLTSFPLIFRYPWHTVDSMTWLRMAGYGWVLVPYRNKAGWDYERAWLQVGFSHGISKDGRASNAIIGAGKHYKQLSHEAREHVNAWLDEQKFDPMELMEDKGMLRHRANCRLMLMAAKAHKPRPFFRVGGGLCDNIGGGVGVSKSLAPFKLLFTIGHSADHADLLREEGATDQLLSYYYFKEKHPFKIERYVRTGKLPRKARQQKQEA